MKSNASIIFELGLTKITVPLFISEQTVTPPVSSAQFDVSAILADGEIYAGIVLDESHKPDYHLILLPGEAEEVSWEDAGKWASERGGVLPTRREQSLLFANLKGEFQSAWYWSGQQHEEESGWAWCQYFTNGSQGTIHKSRELRARAVRRLPI